MHFRQKSTGISIIKTVSQLNDSGNFNFRGRGEGSIVSASSREALQGNAKNLWNFCTVMDSAIYLLIILAERIISLYVFISASKSNVIKLWIIDRNRVFAAVACLIK